MSIDQLWQDLFSGDREKTGRAACRLAMTDERKDELRKIVDEPLANILEAYAEHCADSDGERYLAAGMYRAAAILRELYVCRVQGESLGDVFRTVFTLLDGKRVTTVRDAAGRTQARIEDGE